MKIEEFFSRYKNHPILFIGTGFSLRYLNSAYTWDGLLAKMAADLKGSNEYYLDIKSSCNRSGRFQYDDIAGKIERDFTEQLKIDRAGRFEAVNDEFYSLMASGKNVSRFKIYISNLLSKTEYRENRQDELIELKKISKNVGSIITTNYDKLVENIFEFNPLLGNDILLSNPYGSVYKIHGCISDPSKIIITDSDYKLFNEKYDLIRAQLLSLFIHNPIIFIGYSLGDENIKSILKTIFTYVEPNSHEASVIKDNFLLVEYDAGSDSLDICEHDIDLEGFATIRINKIKTDDYVSIYKSIAGLALPISAMDVRKVQSIVKEIYSGGKIKVHITEDLEALKNGDKIIAIGSQKTISYQYQTSAETISNYFKIIDEENSQLLMLINKYSIQSSQFFPIFGFSKICPEITKSAELKAQQLRKLDESMVNIPYSCKTPHKSIATIIENDHITNCNKINAIFWSAMNRYIDISELEPFLRGYGEKNTTTYRKLLCAYDSIRYAEVESV